MSMTDKFKRELTIMLLSGIGLTALFIVLRGADLYGDSILSFAFFGSGAVGFNTRVEKYCGFDAAHAYIKKMLLLAFAIIVLLLIAEINFTLSTTAYASLYAIYTAAIFLYLRSVYLPKAAAREAEEESKAFHS